MNQSGFIVLQLPGFDLFTFAVAQWLAVSDSSPSKNPKKKKKTEKTHSTAARFL